MPAGLPSYARPLDMCCESARSSISAKACWANRSPATRTGYGLAADGSGNFSATPKVVVVLGGKCATRAMHRIGALIILVLPMGSGAGQDSPAPKSSLRELRFSPDGRYVLAQDDREITILTVQPFSILFRIPAEKGEVAQFTPDSREVVFLSSVIKVDPQKIAFKESAAHVERWSVADRTRVASAALPMLVCGSEELSPDGGMLVCLDLNSTLFFVDVASGQTIFEKKQFSWLFRYDPPPESNRPVNTWGELGSADIDFSPDGRFVVVSPKNADGPDLIWDVRTRSAVRLTGSLKQLKGHSYVFIASDRVMFFPAALNKAQRAPGVRSARVIAFPSGKVLSQPTTPVGLPARATDPGFVIIRHFGERRKIIHKGDEFSIERVSSNRSAAGELSTGRVIISETPPLDVFGRLYVAEPHVGEVGLYEIGKGLQATVVLHKK
jgi:hypothetical protein